MIIGLTGQTGSGKSTVCKILKEKGFYICDCDEVASRVRKDKSIIEKLKNIFGQDIEIGGKIDNRLLAQRAFKDEESTMLLNSIMHPEILKIAFHEIQEALKRGYKFAVLDGAVLFESGADKKCDFMVSVIADENERLERLIKRDKITKEQALLRMSTQKDQAFYIAHSDFIIKNNSLSDSANQVEELIRTVCGH